MMMKEWVEPRVACEGNSEWGRRRERGHRRAHLFQHSRIVASKQFRNLSRGPQHSANAWEEEEEVSNTGSRARTQRHTFQECHSLPERGGGANDGGHLTEKGEASPEQHLAAFQQESVPHSRGKLSTRDEKPSGG